MALACRPALQGLGEVYEEQFTKAATESAGAAVVDEKAEKLRQEAKLLLQVLGVGGWLRLVHRAAGRP